MARVIIVDGQTILEDPEALALMAAMNKINCKITFDLNSDRIGHFVKRMEELGRTPKDAVIGFISVDDEHGRVYADILMPEYNWQEIRDEGKKPFARGLIVRDSMENSLMAFDRQAAEKLKKAKGIPVVVIDYGVAEIYEI